MEGEEACALFRMSPRARTAMRTDSSWSARAMAGQLGAMGGGREAMAGSEGRAERDEDVLGMRTDGSQRAHSRSLRQSTKAHAFRRAIAFTCPSPPPFNLIASPTLSPHLAPALTHPSGLDVARDGLEGHGIYE